MIHLNSNIEIHKLKILVEIELGKQHHLNSNIEIHKWFWTFIPPTSNIHLNSNIEIHK